MNISYLTRYYVSETGVSLIKLMPQKHKTEPFKLADEPKRIGIDVGWRVTPCNDIADATVPVDYNYYIQKARDLVNPVKELEDD